ncbi:hypothetical protein CC78DRAFT_614430 [Lojkania enalia]|uniref:Uncharacterized protein n=1 Tax=Lojkania enalia TaxID=147567 RepID=A0A9P4N289_9PLEO|nr:hypothetical protein CC78DRAFT_614430 [Didymosphaeria enalia]
MRGNHKLPWPRHGNILWQPHTGFSLFNETTMCGSELAKRRMGLDSELNTSTIYKEILRGYNRMQSRGQTTTNVKYVESMIGVADEDATFQRGELQHPARILRWLHDFYRFCHVLFLTLRTTSTTDMMPAASKGSCQLIIIVMLQMDESMALCRPCYIDFPVPSAISNSAWVSYLPSPPCFRKFKFNHGIRPRPF